MTGVVFKIGSSWQRDRPGVAYVASDYSIAPTAREDMETVAYVNELGIQINSADEVVSLSGYFPSTEWSAASLAVPPSSRREVIVEADAFETTGIPSALNSERWPIWHDSEARIVCLGSLSAGADTVVEPVEGVFFGFTEGEKSLTSIWMLLSA